MSWTTNTDALSQKMNERTGDPGGSVLSQTKLGVSGRGLPANSRTQLSCPHEGCDAPEQTHVVDVVWELDPDEGDRRRVRMEVRCEAGHGFLLLISNHAGNSTMWCQLLADNQSPFAEGARW